MSNENMTWKTGHTRGKQTSTQTYKWKKSRGERQQCEEGRRVYLLDGPRKGDLP